MEAPILKNPFAVSSSNTHEPSSSDMRTSQSSAQLSTPYNNSIASPISPTTIPPTESTSDLTSSTSSTSPIYLKTDGRRNSFGEILSSPVAEWKPSFNRVQSWNREDRKREIVLKREVLDHEGRGGGFSEVERERIADGEYVHDERVRAGWNHE